jgi:cytochrome c-type biogenesis protein CcmH/NrfG
LRDYANTIAEKKQAIAAFGSDTPAQSTATALPDVETMLERLVQRLKSHPDDVKGWTTLAWAYANTGRTSDAIGAYEKAIALDPGNGELQAALAAARGNAAGTAPPTNAPAAAASPPAAN